MSIQISELARHAGVYGIGTVVGGVARVALVPIIARYVPTEEYGKASVVLIFITLLSIVSELGLSSSLIKFVNEAATEERKRKIISTVVLTSLLLSVPIALVAGLLATSLSRVLLGSAEYGFLILIGVVGGFGNAVLQVGLSFERAFARSHRYVLYTLIKGGAALALSVVLVVVLRKGALGLLAGSALPPVIIGMVIYGRLIRLHALRFSRSVFRSVFGFGSPLVPMNLAMWILAYSDIYLLRRLTGPQKALSEVGLYQYAHEICLLLVLPITSFNLAWPQFLFANYRRPEAKEIFSRAQLYFAFFLIEIAFLLSVFSDRIISLVGSAQYSGSSEVIPYLAGSLVFYGISVVFTSGLYVTGKTRTLAWVVGACAAINVLLNILLIPRAGKQGAAIATLITNAVMAVGVLVLSQARYRIPYRIGRTMAGVGLAAAVIAVSGTAGSQAIGRIGWARAAGALVFSLALLGIFGINRQDFRDALRALCSLVKSHPRTPAG